jgi:hypothetical protein
MPCADPDDDPASSCQELQARDVLGVGRRVGPVVLTVVLDTDAILEPSRVDAADDLAFRIPGRDLSDRPRQTPADQKQSHPGFLRRLGAVVQSMLCTKHTSSSKRMSRWIRMPGAFPERT